jgi:hypothetical protein
MLSFLKHLFTVKWTNDLLPFQEQQFKYNQSPSPLCPSACGCREDWHHFLRCPHRARKQTTHRARKQSWQDFKQTLSGTFETWKIDPSLRRVFLFSVARLADSDPIPLDNLTDDYTMLMTTQDTIGPDSLLFGYFSPTWTLLQDCYLPRAIEEPVGHHQVSRGIKAIITQTLEQCHCTWLLRNEHLHGTSPFQPQSYKHLHLLQVTEFYDAAPMMLTSDRDIFEIPLEDRRNQTKATLQSFYTFAKPIVDLTLRHAADWGANFRHIDSYFPQQIPPDICAIIRD